MEAVLSSYLAHLAVERGLAANTLASYRRDLRRYLEHLRARGRLRLDEVGEADVRGLPRRAARGRRRTSRPRGRLGRPRRLRRPRPAPLRAARGGHPARPRPRRTTAAPAPQAPQGDRRRRGRAAHRRLRPRRRAPHPPQPRPARSPVRHGRPHLRSHRPGGRRPGRTSRCGCAARAAGPGWCPSAATPARHWTPTWSGPGPACSPTAAAPPRLFLNARGGRLTRQGAWEVLQAAADRAGLAGISPHVSAIPSQPTSSTAAPTLGWSRSCSATPR